MGVPKAGSAPNQPSFPVVPCSRASISARSFGRPVARLFASNASRPMNGTSRPSIRWVTRPAQASSKSSPVTLVMMSIRRGGKPICTIISGFARSCIVTPSVSTGAPNRTRADQTLATLSTWGSIHTSRSPVARGMPCTATAWAPTTRNRAWADSSSARRSVKSSFKRLRRGAGRQPPHRRVPPFVVRHGPAGQGPCLDGERPHHREPLLRRRRPAQVIPGLVTQPELAHRPFSTRPRPGKPPEVSGSRAHPAILPEALGPCTPRPRPRIRFGLAAALTFRIQRHRLGFTRVQSDGGRRGGRDADGGRGVACAQERLSVGSNTSSGMTTSQVSRLRPSRNSGFDDSRLHSTTVATVADAHRVPAGGSKSSNQEGLVRATNHR